VLMGDKQPQSSVTVDVSVRLLPTTRRIQMTHMRGSDHPCPAASAQPGSALALVVRVWRWLGDASDRGQSPGVNRALGYWVTGL
jgi:hypothetical protein